MRLRNVEILENDSNKKGDLFGRLMKDLFHTLGYDEPRINIHKSGREIDLNSWHRTENKVAIAECKAHAATIGGADINKFVGVIDAEKRKLGKSANPDAGLVGYFISVSGFKETAIEQETEFNNSRVILIKPEKLVDELIKGKVLVTYEKAILAVSKYVKNLVLFDQMDLLAYDKGWIWAIYFSSYTSQNITHVAFVHAEGKPLLKELAEEIILKDLESNKLFSDLELINAENHVTDNLRETSEKYFKYLDHELGDIHFEGLPTDKEAGSVRVKLENIFIPLHFTSSQMEGEKEGLKRRRNIRESIGTLLSKNTRLALLAKPGGGKSTLIKRIAISYAFPERRQKINDGLPEINWFPIFLRCRELGEKVSWSITDIIHAIPARAEIQSCTEGFKRLVSNSLQNGTALLLIDGLDEIAEDQNRIIFINQLRTFIATYPNINIIVTSREAGFRVVAGSLASYCQKYAVSNLNSFEIQELCLKWHTAILDDSENTKIEANKLSELILKDNRIKALAENPLLLTTLMFVKRWAGYLPTKRSILYQEMIKLLLVTWNVEGHEILDIEEAEPQLCFVAYWMTKNGKQTITGDELSKCLIDARKQLPEILGYTNISPAEFIKRVESRSSLLILSGHKKVGTGLIAVYEFLHLSFQEYLTAKAVVKKYLPMEEINLEVVDILKAHVNNENWKEVIPLAAVLLERNAKELINFLIDESKDIAENAELHERKTEKLAPTLLSLCLANEVQITPDLLNKGLEWFSKNTYNILDNGVNEILLKNKFGPAFRRKIFECFFSETDERYISELGSTLGGIYLFDLFAGENTRIYPQILSLLKNEQYDQQCCGSLALMVYAFEISLPSNQRSKDLSPPKELFELVLDLLKFSTNRHLSFSLCWAIIWSAKSKILPKNLTQAFVDAILFKWSIEKEYHLYRNECWALCELLNENSKISSSQNIIELEARIGAARTSPRNEFDIKLSFTLGLLLGEKINENDLSEFFTKEVGGDIDSIDKDDPILGFIRKFKIKIEDSEIESPF
ncbi:NACHT domain-containing protein [Pedobacter sp. Leaf176]|uniref:NACHT domain-containing protein n=1 Tax=Pedobacter sp. Leaf176 TaxID=1736286 RepID=UPI0006F473AD|nr:NACHT domain-containing protein [Pedobacter sp. Leaf176]KQR71140.1 hypothetical protein ASF92_07030 [Pedobacter sp. Leaf176]